MSVSNEVIEGCGSSGIDGGAPGDPGHWKMMYRFAGCVMLQVIAFILILFLNALEIGEIYKLFFCTNVIGLMLPFLFANFRPVRRRRIAYEVIWISAAFCVTFALDWWALGFVASEKDMFGLAVTMFRIWFKVLLVGISGLLLVCTGVLVVMSWVGRMDYAKSVKRGKPGRWPWYVKKADGFIRRHPSLVLAGNREFTVLAIRYVLLGMTLPLMVSGMVNVVSIASCVDGDPSWNRDFEIDFFAGEKFGRVLSGDVERKKMSEPIGVFDELMLVADGDPERRLTRICGLKYLGDLSDGQADALAEEVCESLRKMTGFELKDVPLSGRDGFRKEIHSGKGYAYVKWDHHFFQNEKVLRLVIKQTREVSEYPDLKVTEVMGHKIGIPITGDDRPKTPFWKFERIVRQCSSNNVSEGIYAVLDVASLGLQEAEKELEEARKEVENLHGIKMFKTFDGDCLKQYSCYGRDVSVSLKLECRKVKQIRYSVLAEGNWLAEIRKLPGKKASRDEVSACDRAMCERKKTEKTEDKKPADERRRKAEARKKAPDEASRRAEAERLVREAADIRLRKQKNMPMTDWHWTYTGFLWDNCCYDGGWYDRLMFFLSGFQNVFSGARYFALAAIAFFGVLWLYRLICRPKDRKGRSRSRWMPFLWFGCSLAFLGGVSEVSGRARSVWGRKSVFYWRGLPCGVKFHDSERLREKYDRHCLVEYAKIFEGRSPVRGPHGRLPPVPRDNAPEEVSRGYDRLYDLYCREEYGDFLADGRCVGVSAFPRDGAEKDIKEAYDRCCLKCYGKFLQSGEKFEMPLPRNGAPDEVGKRYDECCLRFYGMKHSITIRMLKECTPVPRADSPKTVMDAYILFMEKRKNARQVSPARGDYTVVEIE